MATNYCVSVGQVLASDLKASGITQKELSKRTNIQESVISEIINGRRKMSKNVAIALESVFELPAGYWLEIQNEYELAKEKDGMTIIVKDGSYETTDISAIDIANWFILRAKKDVETSGEYITQLKIIKLHFTNFLIKVNYILNNKLIYFNLNYIPKFIYLI